MKKRLFISICLIGICSIAICYAADIQSKIEHVTYDITLDEKKLTFNSPIFSFNDRTYVPLREFCDALNIKVDWEHDSVKILTNTNSLIGEPPMDRKLSLKDFKFIISDMSMNEIFESVGEPDYYTGSGIMWGVYILEDGNKLHLNDYMTGKIKVISLEVRDGTRIPIDFDNNGVLMIK